MAVDDPSRTIEQLIRTGERYADLGLLGRGGMGEVRRVRDRALDRDVAMKVIGALVLARPAQAAQFIAEAQAIAQLDHPSIIRIYDIGTLPDGRWYFTMPEIRGRTLTTRIDALHADFTEVGLREVVGGFARVCEAIGYAHHRGVVHRDLKPENIMIDDSGEVVVLDWGLALFGGEGSRAKAVAGTPRYMSPEQARGDAIDAQSDVYALGAILHTILTGEAPYARLRISEVFEILRGNPPPPLPRPSVTFAPGSLVIDDRSPIPDALAACCGRAMAAARADRYPSATALAADLAAWHAPDAPRKKRRGGGAAREVRPTGALLGRSRELSALCGWLEHGARLVTLVGPGGVGKTRLASEVAWQWSTNRGTAWAFCDARRCQTAAHLVEALALALDTPVDGSDERAKLDRLIEQVSTVKGVVVLDNLEQVVAPAARVVEALLDHTELMFVATSREALGLVSERRLLLGPLPEAAAVELFLLTAQGTDDLESVTELVRRLDCHPLAVRLAAARTITLTPRQIVDRLSARFELLHDRRAGLRGDAHAGLATTLDWSWGLLTPQEQVAFRQLAGFDGPFSIEAAEAVVDLGELDAVAVFELVQSLRDKSLLHVVERKGMPQTPRFWMYESIAAYAGVHLDRSGERDAVDRRVAAFLHVELGRCREVLATGKSAAFKELLFWMDTAVAATDRTLERGDVATAADLVCAILPAHANNGDPERYLALIRRVEQRGESLPGLVRAWLAYARGRMQLRLGDARGSLAAQQESLTLLGEAPERRLELQVIMQQSYLLNELGRFDESARCLELFMLRYPDLPQLERVRLHQLRAHMDSYHGRTAEARATIERAMAEMDTTQGHPLSASVEIDAGLIAERDGRVSDAEQHYGRALQIALDSELRQMVTHAAANLALLRIDDDRIDEAETVLTDDDVAQVLRTNGNARLGLTLAVVDAEMLAHRGRSAEAESLLVTTLAKTERWSGARADRVEVRNVLTRYQLARGACESALESVRTSLSDLGPTPIYVTPRVVALHAAALAETGASEDARAAASALPNARERALLDLHVELCAAAGAVTDALRARAEACLAETAGERLIPELRLVRDLCRRRLDLAT